MDLSLQRRALLGLAGGAAAQVMAGRAFAQTQAARSFYVSPTGSDSAAGTQAAPWRTLSRATRAELVAGDEVVVLPGTYREAIVILRGGNAAAPQGYVTWRSAVRGAALIRPPARAYSTVLVKANYVIVDGFDVVGGAGHAIDVEATIHVVTRNNIVHDSGGSGIQYNWGEYNTIEGNVAYRNAYRNIYHCSGISVFQNRYLSGDTSSPGYRTIIRNNISFGNFEFIAGQHTDGNGIIVDDLHNFFRPAFPNHNAPTLIENNVCFGNGGKGIAVHRADNVLVRNNTCWRNNLDNQNPATWRSELSAIQASQCRFVNNIAVADPAVNSYNSAIGNRSLSGYVNSGTTWQYNLTFSGQPGDSSVTWSAGNEQASEANGNRLGVDPLLVSPTSTGTDLRVRSGSPAIDGGTATFGLPSSDLQGRPRVSGTAVDIGAYEFG